MTARYGFLGEYLRARRGLVPPPLSSHRHDRKVSGLRRDEISRLTGISEAYYIRLEQGRDRHPSEVVLRNLAKALGLDEFAVQYMQRLVLLDSCIWNLAPNQPFPAPLTSDIEALISRLQTIPMYVVDATQHVLAVNKQARVISQGLLGVGVNLVDAAFGTKLQSLDPNWRRTQRRLLGAMRFNINPRDQRTRELISHLSERHSGFRSLWARHDASPYWTGPVQIRVPYGVLDFTRVTLAPIGLDGVALIALAPNGPDSVRALSGPVEWG